MGVVRELNVAAVTLACQVEQRQVVLDVAQVTAHLEARNLVISVVLQDTALESLTPFTSVTLSQPRMIERLMGVVRKSHGRFDATLLQFQQAEHVELHSVRMSKLAENAILIEKI